MKVFCVISVLLFLMFCNSSNSLAQSLPWQLDLNETLIIKPNAQSLQLKSEKRYLKRGRNLVPLQQSYYDSQGRLLYALHYRYDSSTRRTNLQDSIAYQNLSTANAEPELHKQYFVRQNNKWEHLKDEYRQSTKDSITIKIYYPENIPSQIIKIKKDDAGRPSEGNAIVNLKLPQKKSYYDYKGYNELFPFKGADGYLNYNNLFLISAFERPFRFTLRKRNYSEKEMKMIGQSDRLAKPIYSTDIGYSTKIDYKYDSLGRIRYQVSRNFASFEYFGIIRSETHVDYLILERAFVYPGKGKRSYCLDYGVRSTSLYSKAKREKLPKDEFFYKVVSEPVNTQQERLIYYPVVRWNGLFKSNKVSPGLYGGGIIDPDKVKYFRFGKAFRVVKKYEFH